MAKVYQTPGVYIEEKSAFPNSAVPVATAVPAFIGYTQRAERSKKSLLLNPTRISSFSEYLQFFGGAPVTKLSVNPSDIDGVPYQLNIESSYFTLYSQMKMFFSNGGSDCYIVSVGTYTTTGEDGSVADNEVSLETLKSGIEPLRKVAEPTLLVIPEAVTVTVGADTRDDDVAEIYSVHQEMLKHCGVDMQDRFAITDVFMDPNNYTDPDYDMAADVEAFRNGVGTKALQFGAAYFPWLRTTANAPGSVTLANFSNLGAAGDVTDFADEDFDEKGLVRDKLNFRSKYVTGEANSLVKVLDLSLNEDVLNGLTKRDFARQIKDTLLKKVGDVNLEDVDEVDNMTKSLRAVSTMFASVVEGARQRLNLLPPSAAMAGIYSLVDNQVGVYQAPANISVGSVIAPALDINADQQEDMNVPISGKAVNAIRTFPGKGVLVWGARTLDGNSMDWRYINVRRTVIYLEQSIKAAAEAYVFAPNTSITWVNVRATIASFLLRAWESGALAGASPDQAFQVDIGLGSTMTPIDILDGYMRISVKVAIVRPAEFIVITFEQKMQQ